MLGLHVTTGSRNGLGAVLDAGPSVIVSVEAGVFADVRARGVDCLKVYRDVGLYKDVPAVLEMRSVELAAQEGRALAAVFHQRWSALPPQEQADAYIVLNEPAAQDVEVMRAAVAFESALAERLDEIAPGRYKLVVANLATGTPGDWTPWTSIWFPHVLSMIERGHYYGRHVYAPGAWVPAGYQPGDVIYWDVERLVRELEHLAGAGARPGSVVITELGQGAGYDYPSGEYVADAVRFGKFLVENLPGVGELVLGFALWTYGEYFSANLERVSVELSVELAQFRQWLEDYTGPTPPPDGPGVYRKVINFLPQTLEWDEIQLVLDDVAFEGRQTIVFSHDDVLHHLADPRAASGSLLRFWWPNRWPADLRELVVSTAEAAGWSVGYRDDGEDILADNVWLGPFFTKRAVVTSWFDDPRNYANFLHEGVDLDVPGEPADSKLSVLCGYDGVVREVHFSAQGYGNHVVVESVDPNGRAFVLWYCHLDEVFVAPGQRLVRGSSIGELGSTGNSTGEHLHLTLQVPGHGLPGYYKSDVIDPEPYLSLAAGGEPLLDMADYLGTPDGVTASWRLRSLIDGHEGFEDCSISRVPGVDGWFQVKNGAFEHMWADAGHVLRGVDTSPGGGTLYFLSENGKYGSPWCPRFWKVGDVFSRNPFVEGRMIGSCEQIYGYHMASDLVFIAHHEVYTNPFGQVLRDVVELGWLLNGAFVERYFYARDLGLVGWDGGSRGFSALVDYWGDVPAVQLDACVREIMGVS